MIKIIFFLFWCLFSKDLGNVTGAKIRKYDLVYEYKSKGIKEQIILRYKILEVVYKPQGSGAWQLQRDEGKSTEKKTCYFLEKNPGDRLEFWAENYQIIARPELGPSVLWEVPERFIAYLKDGSRKVFELKIKNKP